LLKFVGDVCGREICWCIESISILDNLFCILSVNLLRYLRELLVVEKFKKFKMSKNYNEDIRLLITRNRLKR